MNNIVWDLLDIFNTKQGGGGGGGQVNSVIGGVNVTVDSTNPVNPIVASPYSLSSLGLSTLFYDWLLPVDSTPGIGRISTNNSNPSLVTIVYVNITGSDGEDLSTYLSDLKDGDWFNISDSANSANRNRYNVIGDATLTGFVYSVPVSLFDVSGWVPADTDPIDLTVRFNSGTDPVDKTRITNLENAQLQITHFQAIDISAVTSGSISFPGSSTLNEKVLAAYSNSFLTTLDGTGNPLYQTPLDSLGDAITANLDAAGNWVASGTFAGAVAIIYVVNATRIDYDNWTSIEKDGVTELFDITQEVAAFLNYTDTDIVGPFSTTSTTLQLAFTHTFQAKSTWLMKLEVIFDYFVSSTSQQMEFVYRFNGVDAYDIIKEAKDSSEVSLLTVFVTLGTGVFLPLLDGTNTFELYVRKVNGASPLTINDGGANSFRVK